MSTPNTNAPQVRWHTADELVGDGTSGPRVLQSVRPNATVIEVRERVGRFNGARLIVHNGARVLGFVDLRENELAAVADALLGLVATDDGSDR
jgi:hypothetical protein